MAISNWVKDHIHTYIYTYVHTYNIHTYLHTCIQQVRKESVLTFEDSDPAIRNRLRAALRARLGKVSECIDFVSDLTLLTQSRSACKTRKGV